MTKRETGQAPSSQLPPKAGGGYATVYPSIREGRWQRKRGRVWPSPSVRGKRERTGRSGSAGSRPAWWLLLDRGTWLEQWCTDEPSSRPFAPVRGSLANRVSGVAAHLPLRRVRALRLALNHLRFLCASRGGGGLTARSQYHYLMSRSVPGRNQVGDAAHGSGASQPNPERTNIDQSRNPSRTDRAIRCRSKLITKQANAK